MARLWPACLALGEAFGIGADGRRSCVVHRRGSALLGFVPLIAGCAWGPSAPTLPGGPSVIRDQLLVYSDFELPRRHRLLEELAGLRVDMAVKLDLPTSDEPIHVFLFDKPAAYQAYIGQRHPDFPDRRAFFLESDTRLSVYACWGDRIGEDLRHEIAHGYLHSVTPNVPLWLDEGLAEFFETPRGRHGLNRPHVDLLWQQFQNRAWRPDLRRIETFADMSAMTQLDYAEAWLWAHFLLHTTRERLTLVQTYLAELRRAASAPPFSRILGTTQPRSEEDLLSHLESLVREPRLPDGSPGPL